MSDQEKGPETGNQDGNGAEPKMLSAADILNAQDRRTCVVHVPEWQGHVRVRGLSGTERDQFEASIVIQKGKDRVISTLNIRAKLCALGITDPADPTHAKRLFSDEQLMALGAKSSEALDRVYAVVAELSGISEKDTAELEGNSDRAGSDDSSSNSP